MHVAHGPRRALAVAMVALLAAGCGGSNDKKPATQVAAKVNKEEISVHQINNLLQRTANLKPEQVLQAGRQILDRLVEQELFVQQAMEKKLDRDPRVLQAIEAARREILSRAYVEQVTANAAKPTAAEVTEFYGKHPELFSERRIYNMRELAIGIGGDAVAKLQEEIAKAKTFGELIEWLKNEKIPYTANTATKAAEQLPLELVGRFHKMKDGQTALIPTAGGILIVQLAASQSQPLDEQQAAPFIEQFILNQRKAELAAAELKNLKGKATIEYVGDYAKPVEESKPAPPAAAPPPAGAGESHLDKGVKGLK